MIYNPTTIIRCLSSQAIYFSHKYGQMFYYSDQNQIWYDTQDGNRIIANDILILQFERQRTNYIPSYLQEGHDSETPTMMYQNYSTVYVIETNCLYRYQNGIWSTIYGRYGQKNVAQTYLPDGAARIITADDVSTNGILNDGSVVIRDNNKMICGLLRSDGYTMNILSLIGGCINLDPSGNVNGAGCLQLNANPGLPTQPDANLNANLIVFGDLKVVPALNWNKQYRLVTEQISITTNTTIKAGSTLTSGSKLNSTSYTQDTVLTSDITATTGLININSKLYKESIINNEGLNPPYLFDIENIESSYVPKAIQVLPDNTNLDGTTLKLSIDFSFTNDGDCCYIKVPSSLSGITKIQFNNGFKYNVDYVASEGINNTAKICFYSLTNSVKVLP